MMLSSKESGIEYVENTKIQIGTEKILKKKFLFYFFLSNVLMSLFLLIWKNIKHSIIIYSTKIISPIGIGNKNTIGTRES